MKCIYTLLFLFLFGGVMTSFAQPLLHLTKSPVPLKELQRKIDSLQNIPLPAGKGYAAKTTAAIFDTTAWASAVNSIWGAGLSTSEKLNVFNTYWGQVDSFYGSFTELPMYNWDSIINAMRTEISGGVSKGRFAGIIGQLSSLINDGHSHFYDADMFSGSVTYGKPVLYGPATSYGACLTMLDDSSAMVYTAIPGNILNLVPGDRVLGYNGIPWKQLVATILRHQLPKVVTPRSTDSATWHKYITAVLSNWRMFDTLNIQKCDGTLVNFPTSVMPGATMANSFCTEQLQVPGIYKLTYTDYYTNNRMVTSGVITGTNIGYVAFYDCGDISGDSLYNPIKSLVEDSLVDGLIIDIRTNYGGSLLTYWKAFQYLNDGHFPWMGWADRDDPANRYSMNPMAAPPTSYGTTDTDPNFFDKKIALLVGPGAISAGDVMQILYTHHPLLKIIGKPTAGAFGAIVSVPMPYSNYSASRQTGDFYRAEDNTFYLSHRNFPIDSFVWFDRASVCSGEDNILTTAIKWIKPELSVQNLSAIPVTLKVYPNPSSGALNILLNVPVAGRVTFSIRNVTGIGVANMVADVVAGENKLKIDLADAQLPAGCYIVEVKGEGIEPMVKKIMIAY
jgi:hypothetical protein